MARTVYEEMLPRWLSTRESAKPPPQESAAARWPLLATLAAPVFTGLATAWFFRGRRPALWSKKVRDVMVDEVVTIAPSATLADAARQMRDHNVGILPVIVAGELAGVITDRDLVVRALAEGADPTLTVVGEFASGAPISVRPDTGLDETMETWVSARWVAYLSWTTTTGWWVSSRSARWLCDRARKRRRCTPPKRSRNGRLAPRSTRRATSVLNGQCSRSRALPLLSR